MHRHPILQRMITVVQKLLWVSFCNVFTVLQDIWCAGYQHNHSRAIYMNIYDLHHRATLWLHLILIFQVILEPTNFAQLAGNLYYYLCTSSIPAIELTAKKQTCNEHKKLKYFVYLLVCAQFYVGTKNLYSQT